MKRGERSTLSDIKGSGGKVIYNWGKKTFITVFIKYIITFFILSILHFLIKYLYLTFYRYKVTNFVAFLKIVKLIILVPVQFLFIIMMNGRKNKFKNSGLSSKENKKKKRYNEESPSSPRAVVKRAENRLSLILKRSSKAEHRSYCSKSENRSAIFPFYKRPRNCMNSKFGRNHKEKKQRFSPRITSTLKCDPDVSVVSDKTFCNSFSVLRLQSNSRRTPDVDDARVGSSADNSVRCTQEAENNKYLTSNNSKSDDKLPTQVVNYQNFGVKIKTSLLEASDKLNRNMGVNLKTKITNLLIETYNKSNKSSSKFQNYRKTPSLENLKVSPAVTAFNNNNKSPHSNDLQQHKNTAVSSSSSSALTPNFDLLPGTENTACPTLIINPVKFLKKYEQGISKQTENYNTTHPLQNLLVMPQSPESTKILSSLTPKSDVVNPTLCFLQLVAFYGFSNKESRLTSADNPSYNHSYVNFLPHYGKPEEHLTYNTNVQPNFNNIPGSTNSTYFRNWGYDTVMGRYALGQPRQEPQENFIFNIHNQPSNFQSLNNWRPAAPLQIKPPENTIFPLSGGTEYEIDIPPDFELKIF
ncbi:hypothetical protein Avbf_12665 [Armadillidium vulgare]|nr:hypothetical protein Avbf_12665 [Armadillidium vulgare]